MKTIKRKTNRAFTLIETLIVLGIMALVSVGILIQLQKNAERTKAKNAGEKIVEVGNALQSYVSDNKMALLAKIPAGTTQTLDDICVLNSAPGCVSDGLPIAEILPQSFTNNSLLGTGYKISLKNVDNKSIDGLVYTDSAVTLGDSTAEPRYDLLGYAAKIAGNAVGFSDDTGDQIDGLNGGWSIKDADLPYGGEPGVLAYRTNGIDNYDGTYLRRDGSNDMTGDLLLGNNNIRNVNSLTADNYVASQSAYFQTLRTQAIYNSGDIYTDSLNAASVYAGVVNTNVVNADNPNKDTIFGTNDRNTASGNLYIGNMTANQSVRSGKDIISGQFIQIQGTVIENTACGNTIDISGNSIPVPNGTLARNSQGLTLSCQGGIWKGSSSVAFLSGFIGNGSVIPLPAGKSQSQCKWIVSSGTNYHGGTPDYFAGEYSYANSSRVVYCGFRDTWWGSPGSFPSGSCQYMIICQ